MNLFDEVKRATPTDSDVVEAIRQWFEAESVKLDHRTLPEQRAEMFAAIAGGSRRYLTELIAQAKSDPDIWEGLRRYALCQAKAGHSIAPDLAIVVLGDAPKRKRGKQPGSTPFNDTLSMLYARAVWCVHYGSGGHYTLSTNDTHTNNAYTLVAEATRATFDQVRYATRGQLDRLTRIGLAASHKGN